MEEYPDISAIEAQTKRSLIEPFLSCLGYDPSHPEQVNVEVRTELGGKIDYVLASPQETKVAVEAKKASIALSQKETNQLRSYFTFSEVAVGILTNGVDYWLFTDLDKSNVMDSEPYRRVDLRNLSDNDVQHFLALARGSVKGAVIHQHAERERYSRIINQIVARELAYPSEEFVRLVGKKAGVKPLTRAKLVQLRPLIAVAMNPSAEVETPQPSPVPASAQPPAPSRPEKTVPKSLLQAALFGEPLEVRSFRELLTAVVRELQIRHPQDFGSRVRREPFVKENRRWQYISTDEQDFSPSRGKHQVGEYWVDTHHSASNVLRRARLFLREFGHDPDQLVVDASDRGG